MLHFPLQVLSPTKHEKPEFEKRENSTLLYNALHRKINPVAFTGQAPLQGSGSPLAVTKVTFFAGTRRESAGSATCAGSAGVSPVSPLFQPHFSAAGDPLEYFRSRVHGPLVHPSRVKR
jgi:hypothetical protein